MKHMRLLLLTILVGALVACGEKPEEQPSETAGSPLPEIDVKCGQSSCI